MLHPYVVGSGMTEMIKRTLYGVGEQYQVGIRLMVTYAVVGLVLMAIGKPWRERREVRRILAGKTTMFADAQTAALPSERRCSRSMASTTMGQLRPGWRTRTSRRAMCSSTTAGR
jgi:hypothetical protein